MSDELSPEDQPPTAWRRAATEDEAVSARPEPGLREPVSVPIMFLRALEDPATYATALFNLTTPESAAGWRDFTEAAAFVAGIENMGFGTQANVAEGDASVAYFKMLGGVKETFEYLEDQVIMARAVVTLVWRPEFQQ